MAGKVFLVVDRESLDKALAEADARDRIVVAEGAFDAAPRLAVDGARWRLDGWAGGVTSSAPTGDYSGYATAWNTLAQTFDMTFAPPGPSDLLALARAAWAARGMDAVGHVTRAERVRYGGYSQLVLEARSHVGSRGSTRLWIIPAVWDDPASLREAVVRCVAELAIRGSPVAVRMNEEHVG